MVQVIYAVLVGVFLSTLLFAYNRIQAICLIWPKTTSPLKATRLCELYFRSRGWSVEPRRTGETDLWVQKGEFAFLVFTRPYSWPLGSAYLQHVGRVRAESRSPVVVVTIGPLLEDLESAEAMGILAIHYKDLAKLEEAIRPQCGLYGAEPGIQCITGRLFRKLANRMSGAVRLAPRADKRLPTQNVTTDYSAIGNGATVGAGFVFEPCHAEISLRPFFSRLERCLITVDKSGVAILQLAGSPADASSKGRTDGYVIQVPARFEKAASGKQVLCRVIARAGTPGDLARFALAYSTNEVGNSGWRWFEAGREWSVFEMTYRVPLMLEGRGDFIGLLPGPQGSSAIEISCVTALVLRDEG